MNTQTTSFSKEVTFEGQKANSLDKQEGITQEFNNNSDPFIIQENAGRAAEGVQKGERGGEGMQGRESFGSAAGHEANASGHDQRLEELKERYAHLKEELPENSREQPSREVQGNESIKDQRLEQLQERYQNQGQSLEKDERQQNLDNGYSL